MDKKIKDDIIQTIKNLRILSMNIINHYLKIKETTSYHLINAKFDTEAFNKFISFDGNYVLKMKNDTDFLFNSSLKKYFEFAPESDPFLLAISGFESKEKNLESENFDNGNNNNLINNVNHSNDINALESNLISNSVGNKNIDNNSLNKKITIKIPEEISEMIKNCQFSILHELIYQEINVNAMNKIDITSTTTGKSSISIISGKNIKQVSNQKNILNSYARPNVNLNSLGVTSKINYAKHNNFETNNVLSKSKSNSKALKKNNLKPISDGNNINNNLHNNHSEIPNYLNQYKANNTPEFYLNNNSKTPDNKFLLGNYYNSHNVDINAKISDYNNVNNFSKYNLLNNISSGNTHNIANNNIEKKKILNFYSYNANSGNLIQKSLDPSNLIINRNNTNFSKKLAKLDNGITSYEKDNNSFMEHGIETNIKYNLNANEKEIINDFKNIDSFLNDSKITKKTDISNINIKDHNNYNKETLNEQNMKIIENIDSSNLHENYSKKKINLENKKFNKTIFNPSDVNSNNFNYADKVNLTDISTTSNKMTTLNNVNTTNKVVIKEKIYIEDKKVFDKNSSTNMIKDIQSDFKERTEEAEESRRVITKENLTRVSHELGKLRTDVLENHYISSLEKVNSNKNIPNKIKKNSKEKSIEYINDNNLSSLNLHNNNNNIPNSNANRAELKSSSSNRKVRLVSGNLPPTGINKGKVNHRNNSTYNKPAELNYNNNNNDNQGDSNLFNPDRNLEGTSSNIINNNQNLNKQSDNTDKLINNLDKSLLQKKKIENSNFDNNYNKTEFPDDIKSDCNKDKFIDKKEAGISKESEDADISNMKSTEKSILEANKNNFHNISNINNKIITDIMKIDLDKIEEDKELKMKILSELKQGEQKEKILTHNLMKKMDHALLSSDEFSIKGEKLIQSQISNRLSIKMNNLKEIKESEKSLNEVYEEENFIDKVTSNNHTENAHNVKNILENNENEIYKINDSNFKLTNLESCVLNDQTDTDNNVDEFNPLYDFNNKDNNKYKHQSEEAKASEKSFSLEKEESKVKNNFYDEKSLIEEHKEIEPSKPKEEALKNEQAKNLTENKIESKSKIDENNSEMAQTNKDLVEPMIEISLLAIEELHETYEKYLIDIDSEQKIIFNISDLIETYLKGNFPKFVLITDPKTNEIISLSTCYYDGNYSTGIRLVLSSFSTIDPENYFKYAEKTIAYLKSNCPNTEIYIELFYGIQNEKFYINEKLRDVFSKHLKFRWITLENTGTQRIVKYRLVNNDFDLEAVLNTKINNEQNQYVKSNCENINSLIDVKINTTIAFKECSDEQDHFNEENPALSSPREFTKEETDVNIFPAIFLLSDLIHKSGLKVNNENLKLFSNEKTRVK